MVNVMMPSLGENVKEGIITNICVKIGDVIEIGQTLIEVETDKITFEVPADVSGKLVKIFVKNGDKINSGDLVLKMESEILELKNINDSNSKEELKITSLANNFVVPPKESIEYQENRYSEFLEMKTNKTLSTPLARKLARELDIEIKEIGISINKRISFNDVKAYARNRIQQANSKKLQDQSNNNIPHLPHFEKFGIVRRQEMSSLMVATSRNMMFSSRSIPHAWVQEKVDVTDLEAHRKKHKGKVEMAGGNLTVTALMVKAVTKALQSFPILNSSLDVENNEIILKEYFNIGVAVDTERGLLVPVIHNVGKKNLTEIAVELTRISKEAKERKTKLEDLEGATFTISNLGGIGTTSMNPIINWPQVAILGLSEGQIEPVWIENEFVPRLRIPLSLGFDHRTINGADAAKFLQYLKKILEDPFLFLL